MKLLLATFLCFISFFFVYSQNPVAVANANPTTVFEGCSGGTFGNVSFSHASSYHPDAGKSIISFDWDYDDEDGLWWNTGADPDFQTSNLNEIPVYKYITNGTYTATLRVTDNIGSENTDNIVITVLASSEQSPDANAGGPYEIYAGEYLVLNGNAHDNNEPCGDSLSIEWDLDGDGVFENDSLLPSSLIEWSILKTIERNTPITIAIKATDKTGRTATSQTILEILDYPKAIAEASPITVLEGCAGGIGSTITFSHAASNHLDGNRTISNYYWDFNIENGLWWNTGAVPDFQTTEKNATPTNIYSTYGDYKATLKITDDTGLSDYDTVEITVNKSPEMAPVVNAGGPYIITEGDSLQLNGNASDDNEPRGDSISIYWDFNNDNIFNNDTLKTNSKIPWKLLSNLEKNTTQTIKLKAIDLSDNETVASAELTIFDKNPVASFDYIQEICDYNIELDASASHHNNPARNITNYEWDINNDGTYNDTGKVVSYSSDLSGSIAVTLKVIDDADNIDMCTEIINIYARDTTIENIIICEGKNYKEKELTGTYFFTDTNQNGCDSIIKLNLLVKENPVIELGKDTVLASDEQILLSVDTGYISYLWNNDSTDNKLFIEGSMGAGIYKYWLKVTDNNDCKGSDTINIEIYDAQVNNVESFASSKIILYPNPMTSSTTIYTGNSEIYSLKVYDLAGKLMRQKNEVHGPEIVFDRRNLNSGIYIIELTANEIFSDILIVR